MNITTINVNFEVFSPAFPHSSTKPLPIEMHLPNNLHAFDSHLHMIYDMFALLAL